MWREKEKKKIPQKNKILSDDSACDQPVNGTIVMIVRLTDEIVNDGGRKNSTSRIF